MGVLSVRLDEDIEKKINFLMEKMKIQDKSAYIRHLLSESLTSELIELLCLEIRNKRISAWKAAKTANISLRAMLYELAKRDIYTLDEQALQEDFDFARR